MKKFWEVLLKVLATIICIPLGIVGAVCLIPFVLFGLLISIPFAIVADIWEVETYYYDGEK